MYGLARPGNRGAGRCCTNLRWAACTWTCLTRRRALTGRKDRQAVRRN